MSEYLIQDTTLINIANPLRTLGETTGAKTPAQMATIATNANTTIATQGMLLDEVIEALEGKMSPPMPSLPNAEDYMFGYVFVMPEKGDIITLNIDGTDKEYLVLKTNGNVAEVLAREPVNDNIEFNDTNYENIYANSTLDIYLNETYYNTLNADTKAAIVDKKDLIQYQYSKNDSVYDPNTHASSADYPTKSPKVFIGDRHIYALGVEDIEEYFNNEFSEDDIQNICGALWNWLSSADTDTSDCVWVIHTSTGVLSSDEVNFPCGICPAFQIDLSKIAWTPFN